MKVKHWDKRLLAVIEEHMRLPYSTKAHHCIIFARRCAEAQIGYDPFEKRYRWANQTRGRVLKRLLRRGRRIYRRRYKERGGTVSDYIEAFMDSTVEEIPLEFAQRGDGILIRKYDGLGVVDLDGKHALIAVPEKPQGLLAFPIHEGDKAWRVE